MNDGIRKGLTSKYQNVRLVAIAQLAYEPVKEAIPMLKKAAEACRIPGTLRWFNYQEQLQALEVLTALKKPKVDTYVETTFLEVEKEVLKDMNIVRKTYPLARKDLGKKLTHMEGKFSAINPNDHQGNEALELKDELLRTINNRGIYANVPKEFAKAFYHLLGSDETKAHFIENELDLVAVCHSEPTELDGWQFRYYRKQGWENAYHLKNEFRIEDMRTSKVEENYARFSSSVLESQEQFKVVIDSSSD
tara:strand:+ start:3337 stop:4083 length:747 start_codon:yes stop_codon:yes gene_type:complete